MDSMVVLSCWTVMVPHGARSIGHLYYCHGTHDPGLLSSLGFPRSHSQCMASHSHHLSLCGIAAFAAEWGLLRTGPGSTGRSGGLSRQDALPPEPIILYTHYPRNFKVSSDLAILFWCHHCHDTPPMLQHGVPPAEDSPPWTSHELQSSMNWQLVTEANPIALSFPKPCHANWIHP